MLLHLFKQQVVVAAAYDNLERPIGVALDATDTCAKQPVLRRQRNRSHKPDRCVRTGRIACLDEANRLSPERGKWRGATGVKHTELRVVLRRLRDLDMGDAANRTTHEAIADIPVSYRHTSPECDVRCV